MFCGLPLNSHIYTTANISPRRSAAISLLHFLHGSCVTVVPDVMTGRPFVSLPASDNKAKYSVSGESSKHSLLLSKATGL